MKYFNSNCQRKSAVERVDKTPAVEDSGLWHPVPNVWNMKETVDSVRHNIVYGITPSRLLGSGAIYDATEETVCIGK